MAGFKSMGTIGLWTTLWQWPDDPAAIAESAAEIERLGFAALWVGGSTGQLALLDTVLGSTSRLVGATGIIQIWSNPAGEVAAGHHRLVSAHGPRFLLGLGVGHGPVVEAAGQKYERPLAKLNQYLDELDAAEPPVPVEQRVIAALRPKALRVAASRAAGSHPYNVPPAHTAAAREILGPDALLVPDQKVLLETDPARAREVARATMSIYLRLPNYLNNLRELGFSDDDFADGGSDRFLDAMVAWGSEETVSARVREHLEAGADQVAVQVLQASSGDGVSRARNVLPRAEWARLAEALLP